MTEITHNLTVKVNEVTLFTTYAQGKMVFKIDTNGQVTFGEGFTADDASRHFIEQLGTHINRIVEQRVAETLANQKERLP